MHDLLANYQPVNIVTSEDYLADTLPLLKAGNTLLITSAGFTKRGQTQALVNVLKAQQDNLLVFDAVTPNPQKTVLIDTFNRYKSTAFTNVIALGGGSVIDSAKVLCAMFSYPRLSLDEVLLQDAINNKTNLIAIPTTAGTGAEVTPFASVWQSGATHKFSLYGVVPNHAVLDAHLTLSLSKVDTLYPALDALSHALESLWNKNKTEQSQKFATAAITSICDILPVVLSEPENITARNKLQQAAVLAGMAISITRTAIAHALSYPLTAKYAIPHGLACSFTLSGIIAVYGHQRLELPKSLADRVMDLLSKLNLPSELQTYASWQDVQNCATAPMDASRAGNFIQAVNADDIQQILLASQGLLKQVEIR